MGMQLPGELIWVLSMLGYDWPKADETKLVEMGQVWISFSENVTDIVDQADTGAKAVWADNKGDDIEAFKAWWSKEDSPPACLRDGAMGATLCGTGLIICGVIVLALKIAVIVQLIILAIQIAQAIATAAATFGGSLAEIPIFQQLARTVVSNLIQEALWTLADA